MNFEQMAQNAKNLSPERLREIAGATSTSVPRKVGEQIDLEKMKADLARKDAEMKKREEQVVELDSADLEELAEDNDDASAKAEAEIRAKLERYNAQR